MDVQTLRRNLEACHVASSRERRKLGRSLGHLAMTLEKADALSTPEDITLAIEALAIGADVHTYPQRYHMSRARLMNRRREVLGLSEPEISVEKSIRIDVEAGALIIADPSLSRDMLFEANRAHATMNEHGFFVVALGGDGAVRVRLRVHRSGPCEPQASEFRRLREATPEGVLKLGNNGVLVEGGGSKRLTLPIPPGDYRICAYGLGLGRAPECLILISPLTGTPPTPLHETPELIL
ncbi:hypothetical protein [Marimonas arenosa]|uniref:Uncharacterized protein n=1 Tax=Marimonas arenosa TaxID=1795305 RepID=A0AAE3WC07_9RHOB|nr:hypothetical protein [Marimonas arenosa]MDQ2090436.1 hypothetical protein [Marimonas arenosa]